MICSNASGHATDSVLYLFIHYVGTLPSNFESSASTYQLYIVVLCVHIAVEFVLFVLFVLLVGA